MIYAGFWRRVAAFAIDCGCLFLMTLLLGIMIGFAIFIMTYFRDGRSLDILYRLLEALDHPFVGMTIGWAYSAFFESSVWQATPGKRALKMVVTDENGERLGLGQASGRHFAKILSALALCIGFLMIGFTRTKQGLHDKIASSLVILRA